jgi:hypothetical protein
LLLMCAMLLLFFIVCCNRPIKTRTITTHRFVSWYYIGGGISTVAKFQRSDTYQFYLFFFLFFGGGLHSVRKDGLVFRDVVRPQKLENLSPCGNTWFKLKLLANSTKVSASTYVDDPKRDLVCKQRGYEACMCFAFACGYQLFRLWYTPLLFIIALPKKPIWSW